VKGPPLPAVRHLTLSDALAAAAESDEAVIFVDGDERERRFGWREVRRRARRAAASFAGAGVRPGDRVAIVLPTCPEFFDAFLGTQLAGAVPVPLYPPVRLGRLDEYHQATARMLERVGARLLVTDERIRRLLGRTVARLQAPIAVRTLAELDRGESAFETAPDPLAVIQFSSGTTVAPKPVAVEHAALMAMLASLEALLAPDWSGVHRGVLWLPLYHDMGLVGALLAIYHPGSVVLIPPERFLLRPALWLRAIARHRGTISAAPSFAYALCADRIHESDLDGCNLSSWRVAMNGAEPISARAARRFVERFAHFGLRGDVMLPVYGLSEATLALTHAPFGRPLHTLADGARELVSVGAPWPGVEIELREGRIFARGPSIMREYFGDRVATAQALDHGWLDTGDLGFIRDGELYIQGRAKDVVIVRGANHAPEEFEECLAGLDGVRPGCATAVGVCDADGEHLLLLIERGRAADATLADRVRSTVLERTGVAPEVELLAPGTLPRTSSGKRRRAEALRRYLAGELTPPAPVTRTRLAFEALRSAHALWRARHG
jgi:acyl-CoA synthetase (AMP-forming)/AMP-acid ligase II